MQSEKTFLIDKLSQPFHKFIQNEKMGGVVLGVSVLVALILANSPLADSYHHFFEQKLGFLFNGESFLEFSLHHWINDGLMAVFFFVVGLELKREIVGGELSSPRNAILPIAAAIGGVIVPAFIYLILNPSGETQNGWGIPMATDIAFALGVLFLLGNRIPLSLKVFLTALAIVDDLCAVLVIAFFYTSDISALSLIIGFGFVLFMYLGNKLGIRNVLFYAILGIGGVWTSFLLSGVHATIAAVIASFTIPADMTIKENLYLIKIKDYLTKLKALDSNDEIPTVTNEQMHLLDQVKKDTNKIIPPLQRLEHALHPIVTFVIIPIFALANAGLSFSMQWDELFQSNVAIAVFLGLVVGKVTGIVGFTWLVVKLKISELPLGMNLRNLFGLGLLASIGFTMSLFVTSLAFTNPEYIMQAKIGIFTASLFGGVFGYFVLSTSKK